MESKKELNKEELTNVSGGQSIDTQIPSPKLPGDDSGDLDNAGIGGNPKDNKE